MKNSEQNLRVTEECELENAAGGGIMIMSVKNKVSPACFGILTKNVY